MNLQKFNKLKILKDKMEKYEQAIKCLKNQDDVYLAYESWLYSTFHKIIFLDEETKELLIGHYEKRLQEAKEEFEEL